MGSRMFLAERGQPLAPRIPQCWFLGFLSEQTVDVAGTVKDTDHIDAIPVRDVEDEVVLKAFDRKPPNGLLVPRCRENWLDT